LLPGCCARGGGKHVPSLAVLGYHFPITKIAKKGLVMTQRDTELIFFTTYILNDFARARQIGTPEAFGLLDDAGIIDGYLLKNYDVLHTLDSQYVVEDLNQLLRIRQPQPQPQPQPQEA
jgi:hypothetical protein